MDTRKQTARKSYQTRAQLELLVWRHWITSMYLMTHFRICTVPYKYYQRSECGVGEDETKIHAKRIADFEPREKANIDR